MSNVGPELLNHGSWIASTDHGWAIVFMISLWSSCCVGLRIGVIWTNHEYLWLDSRMVTCSNIPSSGHLPFTTSADSEQWFDTSRLQTNSWMRIWSAFLNVYSNSCRYPPVRLHESAFKIPFFKLYCFFWDCRTREWLTIYVYHSPYDAEYIEQSRAEESRVQSIQSRMAYLRHSIHAGFI